jgi:hypothetical protein
MSESVLMVWIQHLYYILLLYLNCYHRESLELRGKARDNNCVGIYTI